MCQTEEIEASLDKTWIVSAQSRSQQVLLEEQPLDEPLTIKGPYSVYLRDQVVTYFILFGKTRPEHKDDRDLDGEFDVILFKKIFQSFSDLYIGSVNVYYILYFGITNWRTFYFID